jgi:hypothetical protein
MELDSLSSWDVLCTLTLVGDKVEDKIRHLYIISITSRYLTGLLTSNNDRYRKKAKLP